MDNDALMDKIKGLLSNPEAANMLSGLMESIGEGNANNPAPPPAENINAIQNMLKGSANASDPRINLLSSLKPYMNSTRSGYIDRAIKIMKIAKMTSVFKDLDI